MIGLFHSAPLNSTSVAVAVVAAPFAGAGVIALLRIFSRSGRVGSYAALLTVAFTGVFVAMLPTGDSWPLFLSANWIDAAGIGVGVYVDSLSFLFAVLVVGVSFLSLIYSLRYIPHEIDVNRIIGSEAAFYGYMLLFTGSMLGMVFSGDLIQLYIFWELTGVASFLLIGLDWANPEARRGAVKALLITALGGLAMLFGFILLGVSIGTFSIPGAIVLAPSLRGNPVLAVALALVVVGALTKSAQFPFHVWLPDAMVAPTPVSAFLHSAALVAAGVYIAARLHPIFSAEPLWQWMLTGAGTASMLVGGILALKAREFKELLAYSTISQYGFIFALLGYSGGGAVAAALFSFFNHGLIKAALFFSAGVVTYATGGSELDRAHGLWSRLPLAFGASAVLALSLAGIPLLGGFWMKEGFLGAILETRSIGLIALGVAAGALTFTYMMRFLSGAFITGRPVTSEVERPPLSMLIVLILPALLTVAIGLWPGFVERGLIEPAAADVLGRYVDLDLSLHLDLKLYLSLLALAVGALVFVTYGRWIGVVRNIAAKGWSLNKAYGLAALAVKSTGAGALRLQNGLLPFYISICLLGLLGLLLLSVAVPFPQGALRILTREGFSPYDETINWALALLLLLIGVGTVLTFILARHVQVILALSAVGYLIAVFFALEFAPDVGLVQVHVETLVTVLFILALALIPRSVRQVLVTGVKARMSLWNTGLAVLVGIGSALFSWIAIEYTPADPIGPWYNENAYAVTHAADVVAAILVDFRALDTLGEITVFAAAAIGVYVLIRMVRKDLV